MIMDNQKAAERKNIRKGGRKKIKATPNKKEFELEEQKRLSKIKKREEKKNIFSKIKRLDKQKKQVTEKNTYCLFCGESFHNSRP